MPVRSRRRRPTDQSRASRIDAACQRGGRRFEPQRGGDRRAFEDVAEVGEQPVGNVDRRRRQTAEKPARPSGRRGCGRCRASTQGAPGPRQRAAALQMGEAERREPGVPETQTSSPGGRRSAAGEGAAGERFRRRW